jgi:hypothetical protein
VRSHRSIPRRVNSYDRDAPTPPIGSRWVWELGRPHVQETITVTGVEWNGEEWWVCTIADDRPRVGFITGKTFGVRPGKPYWNNLSRFWGAVSPIPPGRT